MITTLPKLDIRRLAADFSESVRRAHTDNQLSAIRRRNAAETDPSIDHVYDYYDANELMARAVSLQLVVTDWPSVADDMTAAWQRARDSGYQLRRVLLGCEFSGTVRDSFAARGHSVISCDLLPTEAPGPHYQGDVRDIMNDGYHLAVFHPPCTYLTNAGVKHLVRGGERINPERWQLMQRDAELFRDLESADIRSIARENPIMHCYSREIVGRIADQYIQPHHYGHDVSKKTGLWLKNLPKLVDNPLDHVMPRIVEYRGKLVKRWANQSPCGADRLGPSADRGHKRSRFFTGVADAMAAQWGIA